MRDWAVSGMLAITNVSVGGATDGASGPTDGYHELVVATHTMVPTRPWPTTKPSKVPMDFESTVIIVVFYDGTWFKGDDGRFQFKDYQSKVIEIPRYLCSLIDEIISNVAEVYSADERNNDTYAKFTAGSGNAHISTSCAATEMEKGKKKKNMLMCPMLRKLNCRKVKSLKVLFGILKICGKMYHIGKVKHNGKVKSRKHAHLGKYM
ncbi:hypothetical protein FNV43_RR18208 [Rhamnella rubrinervis]|uniref:Uncharacterized protein n=1 Tax=Rhamnella rubrinervis TaxID=2594499 RepID=A0A8K0GY09_9ROSA|nr:hypothetical protein FNV43_RR18208 [Rhamnella rubrinervis]